MTRDTNHIPAPDTPEYWEGERLRLMGMNSIQKPREIGLDPLSMLFQVTDMTDVLNQPPNVAATMMFVRSAMAQCLDTSGMPIAEHCIRVMHGMGQNATDNEKLTALLHDLLEDTDHTAEGLLAMGYPAEVVDAVVILTNKPERDYFEYLRSIVASGNTLALRVKMADNLDNGDPRRLATAPAAHRERLSERYRRAWRILTLQEA